MALLTENKINQFGVKEEYWRILAINLNIQYQYCDITLGAYASAEAREGNAEPMNIKKVRAKWSEDEFLKFFAPATFEAGIAKASIHGEDEEETSTLSTNIYQRAYDYIKVKDDYFKDAIDC